MTTSTKTTTTRKTRKKTKTSSRPPLAVPEPVLFLGLSPAECPLSRARVVFVPAPFDQTTSYMSGTRFGPRAILEASRQVEFYDEELDLEPFRIGIATLAREIRERGLPVEQILQSLRNPVYISIDLDAFDPAYVPGVGTPEPGGLTWEEGLRLLRAVCERRQVVGCDLVELCPIQGQPASDFFAAKLANKLLGYLGFSLAEPAAGAAKDARRIPAKSPRVPSLKR